MQLPKATDFGIGAMALSKSKAPARAVTAVASQIVTIVEEMARAVMWRPSALP